MPNPPFPVLLEQSNIYQSKFLSDNWMEKKGFPYLENNQKSWWDTPINQLKLPTVQTVDSTVSCEDVIQTLKLKSAANAVVVDSCGMIQGIATLGNMESLIHDGKLQLTDPVMKTIYNRFSKVRPFPLVHSVSLTLEHLGKEIRM
ncbi:cystathionine beta-synthase-like [Leucoraja erinacea]|uniref:cystathionine beta-synthase-like n=1 Tax=Leucoraja erinaceus TaxID=7782 RepID=UPI00245634AA|nr:cystathionine beta-synthase-like [Leucoraja erinacea]